MNRGNLGGSVHIGGMILIGAEEAFLVFRKWAEERTRLRVDAELPACHFSCEGFLESAGSEMVLFRLDTLGFISIHLPVGTGFDYGDPDSMRVDIASRIGERHTGEAVRYGALLCAVRKTGERFLFVEVKERL